MTFCRKSIWLLVAVTVLLPAGCAAGRGRLAGKGQVNTAQLLAAARQYEKEGNAEGAVGIYQHVLKYHPSNAEAKEGLALVQQGKLRTEYDPERLLASGNRAVQSNPQAREQLARVQQAQREQVNDRMAELIAQAARNPKKIEVDPTPTPTLVASTTKPQEAKPAATQVAKAKSTAPTPPARLPEPSAKPAKPQAAAAEKKEPSRSVEPPAQVAQIKAEEAPEEETSIESAGFARVDGTDVPADWAEGSWQGHSLADKCQDASAAVLREVRKLESKADADRQEGLTKLAQMGSEAVSARGAVRELLEDRNQMVSAHAAWAIWEIEADTQAATSHLQQLLSSNGTHVVQFACYTLGNMGEAARSAAPELETLLSHQDSYVRLHAAEALSRMAEGKQQASAIATLVALLKDSDAGVRHLSAMALAQTDRANEATAIAALTEALDDDNAGVRSAAALSLGAFGSGAESAVARLEKAVATDHTDVREAATTALACIKL